MIRRNRSLLLCSCLSLASLASCESAIRMNTGGPVGLAERMTAAEESGYTRTMSYAEIVEFVDHLAQSPIAHRVSMGTSEEGRDIPALIIANPPVRTPKDAFGSGKIRFFAFGGIHSGEACGKEALLMLARDLVANPYTEDHLPISDNCVLIIAPLYNTDGNERVSPDNRRGQLGPSEGMGERENVNGLDLNRDSMKLASAEGRSMARFLTEWDPHVVFDSHTTNGSYHQYTLTFEGPLNPSGPIEPLEYTRDEFLPGVSRLLELETGYKSFFYGNFDRELTKWGTYSHKPMFGGPYVGLRNRISILSEAYAYASFEDRVLSTHAFARRCILQAVADRDRIIDMLDRADRETIEKGERAEDEFGIAYEIAKLDEPVVIQSYELAKPDPDRYGVRPIATENMVDYTVEHWGTFTPTRTITRPKGYLIPGSHPHIVSKLHEHGIRTTPIDQKTGFTVERFTVERVTRSEREFQDIREVRLETTVRGEWISVGEGWTFVSTAQPLGNLLVYLLEPESDDGLSRWDAIDPSLDDGDLFPVMRVLDTSD